MTTSSRLRGNKLPVFTIKKGATAATSYADDLKSYGITGDDGDDSDLTFAEAAAGLADAYTFVPGMIVSFDSGSLYGFLWNNPGIEVEIVLGPWGNATPTPTQPHFKFTVNTGRRPDFENTASVAKTGAEATREMDIVSAIATLTS